MTPEDIASHIADLREDFAGLEKQLADPAIYADQAECRRITQEHRKLAALFQAYDAWVKAIADLADTRELLAAEEDPEMREMAESDIAGLNEKIAALEQQVNERDRREDGDKWRCRCKCAFDGSLDGLDHLRRRQSAADRRSRAGRGWSRACRGTRPCRQA